MKAFLVLFSFLSLVACSEVSHKKMEDPQSESWAFPFFQKVDSINPILNPTQSLSFTDPITNSKVFWEERNVLNPAAIVKNDTVFMLYRAQDQWGTSRIGLAYSTDGLHFEKELPLCFFQIKTHKRLLNGITEKRKEFPTVWIVNPVILTGLKTLEK